MKALMEGVGPLAFACLMPAFEGTALPGAPWLVSAACMGGAFWLCFYIEECVDPAVVDRRARCACDCSSDNDDNTPFFGAAGDGVGGAATNARSSAEDSADEKPPRERGREMTPKHEDTLL